MEIDKSHSARCVLAQRTRACIHKKWIKKPCRSSLNSYRSSYVLYKWNHIQLWLLVIQSYICFRNQQCPLYFASTPKTVYLDTSSPQTKRWSQPKYHKAVNSLKSIEQHWKAFDFVLKEIANHRRTLKIIEKHGQSLKQHW